MLAWAKEKTNKAHLLLPCPPPPPPLSGGMFRCSICLSLEKREMEEEKRTFWDLSPSPPAVRLLIFPKSISQKQGGKFGHSHKKPLPFFNEVKLS